MGPVRGFWSGAGKIVRSRIGRMAVDGQGQYLPIGSA